MWHEALFVLAREDIQRAAREELGRDLTDAEITAVVTHFKRVLDVDVN